MRFSIEAEQAVIGGLLLDPNKLDEVLEIISAEDFYSAVNRYIFSAMADMWSSRKQIDVITLAEELSEKGQLDPVGGLEFLVELNSTAVSAANVKSYARIVCDRGIERRITESGQRIAELGDDDSIDVDGKLALISSEVASLERKDNETDYVPLNDILKSRISVIDEKFRGMVKRGLDLGFADLDAHFQGLAETDLWVLAARPSMGKSALAFNIARNVAIQGRDVMIFSLEMSKEQVIDRMISSLSGINCDKIRSGKLDECDWPALEVAVRKMKGLKLHIFDMAGTDVRRAQAICRKFARNGADIGLILVDYLQLMTDSREKDRFQIVSSVSRELKNTAKIIKAPVIALSQLNRACEQRADKRPILADLRESGQIEQDADIISFIYRDDYYYEDSPNIGVAELITRKFREGSNGTDFLATQFKCARFADLAPNHNYDQNWQQSASKSSQPRSFD